MNGDGRIPIPWNQRWQRFRIQYLPIVSFLGCISLTVFLWNRQGQLPNGVGAVEAVRVDVTSGADGKLIALPQRQWTLFEKLSAGQLISRLDDRPAQASLTTLEKELARLQKELDAAAEQIQLDDAERRHDRLREETRLMWNVEEYRLEILDRQRRIESDRVELQRLNVRLDYLERGRKENYIAESEYSNQRLRRDEIAAKIEENTVALEEVQRQKEQALQRLEQPLDLRSADVQKLLAPVRAGIAVQEARIEELQIQIKGLDIVAPISGTITAIHRWPGQAIRAGDPILTVASEHGRYIVSYVRPHQRIQPEVNMLVDVRLREYPLTSVTSLVECVGPQIEPIPAHQLENPRTPEWGLPVRIALPNGAPLRPGELVDLRFRRR